MTNERKIQQAMALIAVHTFETNTPRSRDMRIALRLLADCLTPEQVEEARAVVRAMKPAPRPEAEAKPRPVAVVPRNLSATVPSRPVFVQATPRPVEQPKPVANPLVQAIAQFPREFGFKHFAPKIRFTIDPAQSLVQPDGKVMLKVLRIGKDGAPNTVFGTVSAEGLRAQMAA